MCRPHAAKCVSHMPACNGRMRQTHPTYSCHPHQGHYHLPQAARGVAAALRRGSGVAHVLAAFALVTILLAAANIAKTPPPLQPATAAAAPPAGAAGGGRRGPQHAPADVGNGGGGGGALARLSRLLEPRDARLARAARERRRRQRERHAGWAPPGDRRIAFVHKAADPITLRGLRAARLAKQQVEAAGGWYVFVYSLYPHALPEPAREPASERQRITLAALRGALGNESVVAIGWEQVAAAIGEGPLAAYKELLTVKMGQEKWAWSTNDVVDVTW